ncbi:Uncharacterized protein DAT39_018008, partial [Clarias magur]
MSSGSNPGSAKQRRSYSNKNRHSLPHELVPMDSYPALKVHYRPLYLCQITQTFPLCFPQRDAASREPASASHRERADN